MTKLDKIAYGKYRFHCPGCKNSHFFDNTWTFNRDFETPTVSPSLLINANDPKSRCHLFIRNGKIEFLNDCFHELKGQAVDMVDLDD